MPSSNVQQRRITGHEKRIVAARQAWRCDVCDHMLSATFEVDHIVPLWKGGADDYETNCHALCRECHASKTQKEEIQRLRVIQEAKRMQRQKEAEEGAEQEQQRLQQAANMRQCRALRCFRCDAIVSPYFVHRCASNHDP